MTLDQLLLSLGINIASNFIYDQINQIFLKHQFVSQEQFKTELSSLLNIEGADIYADKIIDFLAKNGDIKIQNSSVSSGENITYSSTTGTSFSLINSVSKTSNTKIIVGEGASIVGINGAGLKQLENGDIVFET